MKIDTYSKVGSNPTAVHTFKMGIYMGWSKVFRMMEKCTMSDKGWISVKNKLPEINKTVEVIEEDAFSCRIVKARLMNNEIGNFSFYNFHEKINHPLKWRPNPEKRPDFSKIKQGDLILVDPKNTPVLVVGYLNNIYDKFLYLNMTSILSSKNYEILKEEIKKITRINLESKTFEEI